MSKEMSKKDIVMVIISILLLSLTLGWTVHISIKQNDFNKECDYRGEVNGYDECETSFKSYPISNVNGKCYCYSISRTLRFNSTTTKYSFNDK